MGGSPDGLGAKNRHLELEKVIQTSTALKSKGQVFRLCTRKSNRTRWA